MRKMIWLACLSYLVIGMAHVVSGAILEPLMAHYGLNYRDGGQFIMNQFLGFLGGVLISPWVTRYIGKRNALLLALGSLTAAEAAYSLLLPWEWMLAIAPIAGFGFGMTEAVIGAMVIEYAEEKKASAMSRIEVFFGLGALIMPIVGALLIRNDIWQMAFPVITAMAGLTTLLWLTLSFGKVDDLIAYQPRTAQVSQPVRARYNLAAMPFLILGITFFLFYVGMEMSFSNYLPSIMIQRVGMDEATAATTISLFWGMVVIGRIFAGRVAERTGYGRFLLGCVVAGMVLLILISFTSHAGWSLFFIGLSGLSFAGVFAIALVYVNQLLPGMTERTTSLLVAFGGMGGALFPRLTGWLMDEYDASWTLGMIAGMSILMVVLVLAMMVIGKQLSHSQSGMQLQSKGPEVIE
ncbi:MFS transporter [Paenibacillus abyssi]|uniref:MFS transporter n=1 Tax=Paenibacillus abyssi TaxID=1340531 RepID=A0A917LI41_9BACL|nr:MFS transporter [Paenibacillus abyssi]GGG25428.1 MFS transporter [Paenibacillus abyssi]